jgi:3-methyladenine DNA glycosylase AlkC
MAEPFKLLLNPDLVRATAAHLGRAWPAFPRTRFVAQALADFDGLEMKARAMRIADALESSLPADFARAADVIESALAPARDDEDLGALRTGADGLAGWIVWPLGEFVARRGLADPERALASLHALTRRFSAEFAIRPFILAHPRRVYEVLARWTRDPSPHVRRLVSEGTRPRLPWGIRLQPLVADPSPSLPLLRALQDDSSAYVRRSVANHLNDIAKDHPGRIVDWLREHLPDAGPARRALLRHASRTLVKRGDPAVLAAWGLDAPLRGSATLEIAPARVRIGAEVTLALDLRSTARRAQRLEIDYRVHHVRARGDSAPKVFKGWKCVLDEGATCRLTRRHDLRVITTRRYHPGWHRVEVTVNGRVVAESGFELVAAAAKDRKRGTSGGRAGRAVP